jgi:hypothetical protein
MPAYEDGAAHMGAGVGKRPGKEPARDGWWSGRECYGDLWLVPAVSVTTCDLVVRRSQLSGGLIGFDGIDRGDGSSARDLSGPLVASAFVRAIRVRRLEHTGRMLMRRARMLALGTIVLSLAPVLSAISAVSICH